MLRTATFGEWVQSGRTKEVTHFIVDWKNGTRVACNNGAIRAKMCINFAQLYLHEGLTNGTNQ